MTLRLLLCGLFALVCAACASSGAPAGSVSQGDSQALQRSLSDYKLGPGDQLRISVFDEPSLSGEFVVSPQGKISFPLLEEVNAQGLTVKEFNKSLETALLTYVRAPRVSSEVLVYRPFYILGEVVKPGTYPFAAGLTVQNAAATAGGFTYRADTRRVFIKHVGEERETAYPLTSQTPVQPGDTVRISERIF
jgi:protein involved in polysaccharide export with SLBB domain